MFCTSLRKKPVSQAVFATLMGLSASSAYAVNVGQATVQSQQHEPLVATIAVNNIDSKNFNASLASSAIYQQMGLEQTQVSVQFVPTSDTAGRILLTTTQPISTPFADIVLNIDNNGEHHIEPQTLLMPLPKNGAAIEPLDAPINVATDIDPNLPVATNDYTVMGETLTVSDEVPPFIEDQSTPTHTIATSTPTSQSSEEAKVISRITPDGTNTQLDILTEQVTRKVLPAGSVPDTQSQGSQPPFLNTTPQDDTPLTASETLDTQELDTQESSTASYVVQSGDSLWKIANEIAKANNLGINEVIKDLHAQNPDAFNHNNINRLKANATLRIANYEVVPSQKAISEAIAARTNAKAKDAANNKQANSTTKGANHKANTRKPSTNINAKSSRVAPKPLPKPQVTLVTPSKTGSATGSSRTNMGGGSGGGDLVASLRTTRSSTAESAKRVNGLNQELSSATKKLHLQNQKLAELEARLKALKDN